MSLVLTCGIHHHLGREGPEEAAPTSARADQPHRCSLAGLPCHTCSAVRGFLVGLALLLFVTFSVLSLRPGGLRNQLRNVGRRLKIALTLAGIYLVAAAVLRLALPNGEAAQWATAVVGLLLALAFVVLGQDRQLDG